MVIYICCGYSFCADKGVLAVNSNCWQFCWRQWQPNNWFYWFSSSMIFMYTNSNWINISVKRILISKLNSVQFNLLFYPIRLIVCPKFFGSFHLYLWYIWSTMQLYRTFSFTFNRIKSTFFDLKLFKGSIFRTFDNDFNLSHRIRCMYVIFTCVCHNSQS